MSLTVTPEALDVAIVARKVRVDFRPASQNKRPVRCVVGSCRAAVLPGTGRPIYLDGHRRGYLCPPCVQGVRHSFGGPQAYVR